MVSVLKVEVKSRNWETATQGAMYEDIRRAHLQCHVWQHVLVANSSMLESTTLGWSREANCELMPVLTRVPLAPRSVLQLVHIFLEVHQLCIQSIIMLYMYHTYMNYVVHTRSFDALNIQI